MRPSLITLTTLATALHAQSVAVFPADYVNVAEGPSSSNNLPLANGTSRVMILYENWDLPIPAGASINRLGFREDGSTASSAQHSLQLEIRMGYTANGVTSMVGNFDNNYSSTPVTVFGPAVYALPRLRDPVNPLPNGQFWIDLTTPFPFDPTQGNLLVEYRIFGNTNSGSSFTYRLDRADFYSPTAQGPAGCGTSSLGFNGTRVGSSFTSQLTQAPANSLTVLLLNVGRPLTAPFPLQPILPAIDPTCMGQIDLTAYAPLIGFTNSGGSLSQSFSIPNSRTYDEVILSGQAAVFDFFAPGGIVVSNGAQVEFGIRPHSAILSQTGPPASVTTGSVQQFYCPVAFFGYQ